MDRGPTHGRADRSHSGPAARWLTAALAAGLLAMVVGCGQPAWALASSRHAVAGPSGLRVTATLGTAYALPAGYFGINYDYGGASTIPSGAAITSGAGYRQATGDPTEQVSAASRLTTSRGTVTQAITLAPYSLALVG
jgi:hypothetical protein